MREDAASMLQRGRENKKNLRKLKEKNGDLKLTTNLNERLKTKVSEVTQKPWKKDGEMDNGREKIRKLRDQSQKSSLLAWEWRSWLYDGELASKEMLAGLKEEKKRKRCRDKIKTML